MTRPVNFWFFVGLIASVLVFTVLNYLSYVKAFADYQNRINRPFHIDHVTYQFGFPFTIYQGGTCYPCEGPGSFFVGILANIVIALALGAVTGAFFEFVSEKVGRES